MISQGSIGILGKQRLLNKALLEVCCELGLPDDEADELIDIGRTQFTIDSNGKVKSLGQWPNIRSFINARGLAILQPETATTNAAEQRAKRKAELFELLCFYADCGDGAGYRQARMEYALL